MPGHVAAPPLRRPPSPPVPLRPLRLPRPPRWHIGRRKRAREPIAVHGSCILAARSKLGPRLPPATLQLHALHLIPSLLHLPSIPPHCQQRPTQAPRPSPHLPPLVSLTARFGGVQPPALPPPPACPSNSHGELKVGALPALLPWGGDDGGQPDTLQASTPPSARRARPSIPSHPGCCCPANLRHPAPPCMEVSPDGCQTVPPLCCSQASISALFPFGSPRRP